MAKITSKEATYRQWFASKYGNVFENFNNWNLPNTIANLDRQYQQDLGAKLPVSFNFSMDKLRLITDEIRATGMFELYLDEYNAGLVESSEIVVEQTVTDAPQIRIQGSSQITPGHTNEKVVFKAECIDDMDFPTFNLFKTGEAIDEIMSDHEVGGGLYGGTVTIVTGESGVGKSTLLIDYLAKVKKYKAEQNKIKIAERVDVLKAEGRLTDSTVENRYVQFLMQVNELKVLYISTEMTKTDIYFYKQKMPQIGSVPTLLATNYLKNGLKDVIIQAFETKYDIILLDSYQDLVEKLKDIMSWKATYAGNFLINLMVESAEQRGTAVFAIQHLTKGGEYVGSTFLKHTTTAMLTLVFDGNQRAAVFTKNRRGGSVTHKPMYFTLKNNQIEYDREAWDMLNKANGMAQTESDRQKALDNKFADVFNFAQNMVGTAGDDDNEDDD